jgi:diacylglycerol kinase (ATP)
MTEPYALIANPTARSGRGRRGWRSIEEQLERAGVRYRLRVSEYSGHATLLAREEADRGTDVVVAVGGDGTINEVLCGVMQSEASRRPALGILYTGTSPDVCRFHGIPLGLPLAIATLLAGHRRRVDVGAIRFCRGAPGETEKAWFLCSANLGVGAAVARASNGGLRRYLGDFLGTLCATLGALLGYQPLDLSCVVDGEPVTLERVINVTVGKNPFIASGLKVVSPIASDDGRMYLMVVKGFSWWGIARCLPRLYRGTFQHHPNNLFRFIQSFTCTARGGAVEFDGDPHGFMPCTIELERRALELIVPAEGA